MAKNYARHAGGFDKKFRSAGPWGKIPLLEEVFSLNGITMCSSSGEGGGRMVVVKAKTPEKGVICLPIRKDTSLNDVQNVSGMPQLTFPASA